MNASSDRVLDWNIDWWQCGDEYGVDFVCIHLKTMEHPDRRCKSGVRTWQQSCGHRFASWYTIRELIETVQEHIEKAHPDLQNQP